VKKLAVPIHLIFLPPRRSLYMPWNLAVVLSDDSGLFRVEGVLKGLILGGFQVVCNLCGSLGLRPGGRRGVKA
jgi:hypothetical protein